ncbi:MAG: hypothetical protein ABL927_06370 [Bdellovibrionales bacterium]
MSMRVELRIFFLFFILVSSVKKVGADELNAPFWQAKPKVFKRVVDDREIIVSVTTEKLTAKVHKFSHRIKMQGGGLVYGQIGPVFSKIQRYSELTKVSGHILEVLWTPATNELFIHTEAFKFHAVMTLKIQVDNNSHKLKFNVIKGHFEGMSGEFSFMEFAGHLKDNKQVRNSVLMGFNARYDYQTPPMPQFLMEFGLEVILQKVAGLMRSYLEKQPAL